MPYCTIDDIRKEIDEAVLIDLTDDPDNPTGTVGQANVESAITRADAIIDGYLSTRLTVPAETTPTLTALSVDLALYTIFSRKENVTDIREERYKAALDFLKAFSKGDVNIGTVADPSSNYPVCETVVTDFDSEVWSKY